MREYITTMSVAAIIASLFELLAPKEWEKYIKIGIGIIILSVIISPVAELKNAQILPVNPGDNIEVENFYRGIVSELAHNVERDIEERLLAEFNMEVKARVDISIDEENRIKGVNAITLYALENPPELAERLEEIYGCKRIEIKPGGAFEKNYE